MLLIGARGQVDLPRSDPVPAAPLRPERRRDHRLQVPQHDGLRGRRRGHAGDEARPAGHAARPDPALHLPG